MTWPVIVLNDALCNPTLSTIKFDKFGTATAQVVHVCDSWTAGFEWAKQSGYSSALFVRSGTLFSDWSHWQQLVDSYPHQGLIAHIIAKPGQQVYLDDQCWFINLDYFDLEDLVVDTVQHPCITKSQQNIHDNYTPLWIKPSPGQLRYRADNFGQGLIAKQLANNRSIVNWTVKAREIKSFCYNQQVDLTMFQDYKNIAEQQLWVLNNEPIEVLDKPAIVMPGSGLAWIVNIVNAGTDECTVVDISKNQVRFAKDLWQNWNGSDYGKFAWDFIQQHNIVHYQLDKPDLGPIEKLQMKSRTKFIDYVNTRFAQLVPADFQEQWQQAKQNKSLHFYNDNLINWVLNNDITAQHGIWCSNIFNYKWTLLHSSREQYSEFDRKTK